MLQPPLAYGEGGCAFEVRNGANIKIFRVLAAGRACERPPSFSERNKMTDLATLSHPYNTRAAIMEAPATATGTAVQRAPCSSRQMPSGIPPSGKVPNTRGFDILPVAASMSRQVTGNRIISL
jgi:hypothetical protein